MSARREHNGLRGLTLAGCCSVAAPSALRLHSNELAAYPNDMAGRKRKNLSFEQLQPHFQQTLKDAAAALDLSVNGLKKTCRRNGITSWPYRKIQKLRSERCALVSSLSRVGVSGASQRRRLEEVRSLDEEIDELIRGRAAAARSAESEATTSESASQASSPGPDSSAGDAHSQPSGTAVKADPDDPPEKPPGLQGSPRRRPASRPRTRGLNSAERSPARSSSAGPPIAAVERLPPVPSPLPPYGMAAALPPPLGMYLPPPGVVRSLGVCYYPCYPPVWLPPVAATSYVGAHFYR